MDQFENNVYDDTAGLTQVYNRVFGLVAAAVGVSALTVLALQTIFYNVFVAFTSNGILYFGAVAVELILVFVLGRSAMKDTGFATIGLFLFAILNGFTLSIIIAAYTSADVLGAFVGSAAMFAGMSLYGAFTKRDLSAIGRASMGLVIGLLVSMFLNAFILHSSAVTMLISCLGVLIFAAVTAWDSSKIKTFYNSGQATNGITAYLALSLYLDFINIFIFLLQIFGGGSSKK
ncbi:MAG: Bax inhibitor-1/YccA family protein [Lactobacillales bacterium]|jgi:FtsH-binding integral membrane protein|nr:Bax inhibitor-1/YccA family protein [Lactobacillales bacterium]